MLQSYKVDLSAILANNSMTASKIIAGKDNKTLREFTDGFETWYEIKTKHSDSHYSSEILDTPILDIAKKRFLEVIK